MVRKEFVLKCGAKQTSVTHSLSYLEELDQKGLLSDFDEVPDLLGGQRGELDALDPLHGEHPPVREFVGIEVRRTALG